MSGWIDGFLVGSHESVAFRIGSARRPNRIEVIGWLTDRPHYFFRRERTLVTEEGGGLLLELCYPAIWRVSQNLGAASVPEIKTCLCVCHGGVRMGYTGLARSTESGGLLGDLGGLLHILLAGGHTFLLGPVGGCFLRW